MIERCLIERRLIVIRSFAQFNPEKLQAKLGGGAPRGFPLVRRVLVPKHGRSRPIGKAILYELNPHRSMLIAPTSPFFFSDRVRLAEFALRHRILSMFVFREWVDAGGLLSYGPSITALFARVAEFVDRIARGALPANLPIEQPTKFEMVVNLKTAKAIGIELPTAILLRADEVIE